MKNKLNIYIILFLLLLPCLFFFQALFGGKTFVGTDIQSFFYPFKYVASQMYRSGQFHLWDPYIFAGLPVGSEIQTALFYPLNLFYAVLPIFKATSFFIVFHLFLMSLFMYLYLQEIKLSRAASLFGALAFTYSGYSMLHVDQISMLAAGAWLPVIFLFIEKASKERGLIYPTLAGVAVGLQFLAGHPQVSAIIGFAVAFYIIFKLYGPVLKKELKEVKRLIVIAISVAIIGLTLASIALIPFLEAQSHSMRARAGSDFETSSAIYVSPGELQTFLIPELRAKGSEVRWFGGTGETYAGVIPVFLALFAIIFVRGRFTVFYLILGLFSLFAAFGKAAPLHYVLYYLIPFYGMLQIPIRFMFLYTLSISVLSAVTLDYLSKGAVGLKRFVKWAVFLVISLSLIYFLFISSGETRNFLINVTEGGIRAPLIFLLIFGAFTLSIYLLNKNKISYNVFVISLIVITLVDLLSFGTRYFKFAQESIAGLKPGVFEFLERDKDLYRVSIGVQDIGPNLPMVYKIQSISGYSPVIIEDFIHYVIYNSTHSLDFSRIPSGSRFYIPPGRDTRMIGLLNVKYHIFPFMKDGMYYVGIRDMKNYYPRAFIVPRYLVLPERKQILVRLGDENFDPQQIILLESDIGLLDYSFSSATKGRVSVVSFSPDRIDIKTESNGDVMLFLSEIYYPGWKVYVDGIEGKIYRANYIFRSVPLRAGKHSVSFVYDPLSFKIGKYISLFSLVLCLGLVGYSLILLRKRA